MEFDSMKMWLEVSYSKLGISANSRDLCAEFEVSDSNKCLQSGNLEKVMFVW